MRVHSSAAVAGLAASALVAVLPSGPVAANPCDGKGGVYEQLGLSGQIIQIGSGESDSVTVYIDDRDLTADGLWIYLEGNGQDGYQRGDETAVRAGLGEDLGPGSDPCDEDPDDFPDQILF